MLLFFLFPMHFFLSLDQYYLVGTPNNLLIFVDLGLTVRLLFFNVKLMHFGIGLVVLDVLQIPTGNAGGHLAHIGGAALGYFYATQLTKGNDIGTGFERLWNALSSVGQSKPKMKPVYKAAKKTTTKTNLSEQEKIDRILDKISASGYDSLTKEESYLVPSR